MFIMLNKIDYWSSQSTSYKCVFLIFSVLWTQGFCILLVLQLCSLTSQVYGDEDLSDDLPENVLFKDFADPSISENEQNDIKTNDSELVPPTLESSTSLLDANISDSHVKSLDAVLRNSTERIPQHSSNIFKNETFENVTDLSVIDKSSASAVVPNQSTTRLSSQKPTLKPPVGGSTKPGQTIQMTTILPNHNDTGPQNSSKFEGPEEYQFTTAIIVGIACGSAAFVVLLGKNAKCIDILFITFVCINTDNSQGCYAIVSVLSPYLQRFLVCRLQSTISIKFDMHINYDEITTQTILVIFDGIHTVKLCA